MAHLRARAARTRVRKEREVFTRLQAMLWPIRRRRAELHEMIATAARAELLPRLVAQTFRRDLNRE